jgi:hypothetical protein
LLGVLEIEIEQVVPKRIVLKIAARSPRSIIRNFGFGKRLGVVIQVHRLRQPPLLQVADAGGPPGFFLGPSQGRQEHRRKNADNGNHDEQFDQCESALPGWLFG